MTINKAHRITTARPARFMRLKFTGTFPPARKLQTCDPLLDLRKDWPRLVNDLQAQTGVERADPYKSLVQPGPTTDHLLPLSKPLSHLLPSGARIEPNSAIRYGQSACCLLYTS